MNILFVLPFYHTNLHSAVLALTECQHSVHIVSAQNYGMGQSSDTDIQIVDQSCFTFKKAIAFLRDIQPNALVVRKSAGTWRESSLSQSFLHASITRRIPARGYDLRPYLKPRDLGGVLRGPLRGRPIYRFTPVHGLTDTGPPDKYAKYIPLPVGFAEPRDAQEYLVNGTIRIICVGKFRQKRKNHFLLIKALEPLLHKFSFMITFVGSSGASGNPEDDHHFAQLKRYQSEGPLGDRMQIIEDVPFEKMGELYRHHDICVMPSLREPLGIASLEAMAQGCVAVIASDAGAAYYVESGVKAGLPCGALFPPNDSTALHDVLERYFSNPDTLFRFGRNAQSWAKEEFNPEKFVNRFLALFGPRLLE
jgi:glycosyltransferase involved in cell wall biosynthesis